MPADATNVGKAANNSVGFFGSCTFFGCDAHLAVLDIRLSPLLAEKMHMSSKHEIVVLTNGKEG